MEPRTPIVVVIHADGLSLDDEALAIAEKIRCATGAAALVLESPSPQVSASGGTAAPRAQARALLSAQESRVWALLAEGLSNLGIAHHLGIAEGTVEKHCSNLFAKLQLDADPYTSRRVVAALRFRVAPGDGQ